MWVNPKHSSTKICELHLKAIYFTYKMKIHLFFPFHIWYYIKWKLIWSHDTCFPSLLLLLFLFLNLMILCHEDRKKKLKRKKMMSRRIANLSQANSIINLFRSTCELVYFCWLMHFSLSKDTELVIFQDRNTRPTARLG